MKLTDKQMMDILSDMVIICDTREQKNQHILDYFKENNIPYIIEKLDTADYSFILPNYPDIKMDKMILIEKKNSLDEIAGNFTKDRERFAREFERVDGERIHLLIENATFKKLLNGSYRSKFPPKSFLASLLTWNVRYNCPVWFTTPNETGIIIRYILYYELLEHLKGMREV
jgi:ERCC4-type nuclease